MNNGLNPTDPTVVAAFRSTLVHQGIVAVLIFAVLSVAWISVRELGPSAGSAPARRREPGWRRVLRVGFGLLWILDAVLQAQPAMAAGLPSQVLQPHAAGSPAWVQHMVAWAGTGWSYHPVQMAAAVVWIEAAIGIWMVASGPAAWSRVGGLVGAGWALVVWVFGESFGGVFAPGLTWLAGAPGAALLYLVAGGLIALPERTWPSRRLGQAVLAGMGVFLLGMAVLQAWPGRGFWTGTSGGQPGTLASVVQAMAITPQPHALASLVGAFGTLVRSHGFAVNLAVVMALAVIGAAFLTGRRIVVGPALAAFAGLCAVAWVLVEDFGVFGGVGTDPGSMIPMMLLAVAGFLALPGSGAKEEPARLERPPPQLATAPSRQPAPHPVGWRPPELAPIAVARRLGLATWHRFGPAALRRSLAAARPGTVAAAGAAGLLALGVLSMLQAQADPVASTVLAQAIDGSAAPLNFPAPDFALTDEHGRQITLRSLRGKVVLLTFLDPVCVTQCPLEAQEFKQAQHQLGTHARQVELVAINANPLYNGISYLQAFDHQEGLDGLGNWAFLTGSPAQLGQVYRRYGFAVQTLPAGSMLGHGDNAFVIDPAGRMCTELNFDPGPGTDATISSFAAELVNAARQALAVT
jgi:cytochrome oxidase Cu insertion factor (SCO1/SenC/PrrC family)